MKTQGSRTVADFFAGIGLVTLGFQRSGWETIYALDYDDLKAHQYSHNFGGGHYHTKDIFVEQGSNVPKVTLAHASFPCTDLSLAGARGGIYKGQSSAFWAFARILREMREVHGEANPRLVLLENVEGLLTSNGGEDLRAVIETLNRLGYRADLLRIDASHFVPQSRVRIFIIGVHHTSVPAFDPSSLNNNWLAGSNARPNKIVDFILRNDDLDWYIHNVPNLPKRTISLKDIIDVSENWWPDKRTEYLYNQLHDRQKLILDELRKKPNYHYFPGFRRMRNRNGINQSTVELRNDGIAGCLRTPKGGSARQILVRAGNGRIDARLFSAAEAGRLMGANEFKIDSSLTLNQALFGFGDAVCVPVLEWLGNEYFNSIIENSESLTHELELSEAGQFSL